MKKCLPLFFFVFWTTAISAQKNKADSFAALLVHEKKDSNRVTLLWNLANASSIYNPDTALFLSQHALQLAKKIKFTEGESMSLLITANIFLKIGNYPRALEFYLEQLRLLEKKDDPLNLAGVTMNIGAVYVYQEEYRKALPYYYEADSVIAANGISELKYNIALNLGDAYNRLNIHDSAFNYFKKSLDLAISRSDGDLVGTSMVGLGHNYFKTGKDSLALQYYRGAMPYLDAAHDEELICEASIGLAKLFEKMDMPDSAETAARLTATLALKDGFLSWQQEAAAFLKDHFKRTKNYDSAFFYIEQSQAIKDSINSKERIRESQVLSSNEQLRQIQLAEDKRRAKEERSKQLQFLFIGIFIPGLFLLTLFLSRMKVHVRFIKFTGIISLLILFEYLTLLLHPYVLELTHHTPVFEIMIFVLIASFVIPTHHHIESWMIEKLTSKRILYTEGHLKLRMARFKKKKPAS